MAKRKRPSLKNYLATGRLYDDEEFGADQAVEAAPVQEPDEALPTRAPEVEQVGESEVSMPATASEPSAPSPDERVLELARMLNEEDAGTWMPVFRTADVEFLPLELVERREDFRKMDRVRFTLFKLEKPGEPLFHVRSSVRICEPLAALIKWDETGKVQVFLP
ncbi:MAG: hypothetical protein GX181_10105 [Synergistaceae bacterium]|nr:hypothetical protein [Synergistota bacterium]NLM72291.1 hypothetical protein [Synergistaceae bacterium]